jgi:prepilin-type N-terminal cleavage/methylation domain-containing protein
MIRHRRNGITLVEILVVIAIIGILMALLLPAVQSVREAARRTQCANNAKQICTAMQLYHDSNRMLPPGAYGWGWGTWQIAIQPQMENGNLYDLYDHNGKFDVPDTSYRYHEWRNLPAVSHRLPSHTCPSDEPNTPNLTITSHNYAVNFGNTDYKQARDLNGVVFKEAPFGETPYRSPQGVYYRLASITDGLTNTLMVAEVLQGRGHDVRGLTWWGEAAQITTYLTPNSPLPDRIYVPDYCNDMPRQNLPCAVSTTMCPAMFASRSAHPGGVQVGLCDASVRFVAETIELEVWRASSTSRGGETDQLP